MRRALGALSGALVALAVAAGAGALTAGDLVTAATEHPQPATASTPAPSGAAPPSAAATPATTPATAPTATPPEQGGLEPSTPVRLRLPALHVDAAVEPVSIGADGVLVPPNDPGRLGWWDGGAKPGARRGAALLTGHSVRRGGGALDELESAGVGATLTVDGADGAELRFRVSSVDVMSKERLARAAGRLFAQDAPGRLVLVTCEDYRDGAWRSNVVVVAVPVDA